MADYLLQVLKDRDAVARAAADYFVSLAPQPQRDKRPFLVALAGGMTPQALYALLASAEYRNRVAWDHVSFFFSDERAVPPDYPDSNYRTAHEALFRPLNISEKHVYRMKAELPDLEAAATDYERALQSAFDGGRFPRFDLIFLGMGPDGHTASLFPGHPALAEGKRWVVAVLDAPKPPPCRLTLTVPVLNAAKLVLFMTTGADKAQALQEVLEGDASPDQYPAKHVRPGADRLIWLVDEAAGGTLSHSFA
jgi:6-phosphogluconolactonase